MWGKFDHFTVDLEELVETFWGHRLILTSVVWLQTWVLCAESDKKESVQVRSEQCG